jgi:hypothetical protein
MNRNDRCIIGQLNAGDVFYFRSDKRQQAHIIIRACTHHVRSATIRSQVIHTDRFDRAAQHDTEVIYLRTVNEKGDAT